MSALTPTSATYRIIRIPSPAPDWGIPQSLDIAGDPSPNDRWLEELDIRSRRLTRGEKNESNNMKSNSRRLETAGKSRQSGSILGS